MSVYSRHLGRASPKYPTDHSVRAGQRPLLLFPDDILMKRGSQYDQFVDCDSITSLIHF